MFRKAEQKDCERVYRLICDLENRELPYDRFLAIYREQLEDGHFYCLVCEQDQRVIGVLNMRFEGQLHHSARIAEVMEFEIDADFRNRGIGRAMFARACELAKESGCVQIELATNQLRSDAHRFYAREGMHNFHYKFSKSLEGEDASDNAIGR